jgi:hypothetical protein
MRNTATLPIPPPLLALPFWGIMHLRALELLERKRRQDELLDDALEGTFPASDPVGPLHIS